MWDYTDKVLDHFHNPRNVGKIENPDGIGHVGSLACGDALTFMFKLDKDGRIADAKFQTFGCASAIASSSALTEMVIGKTLEEAEKITNKEIADFLGGLPEQKMHCSVMGREALEAAIHNYRTGEEGKAVLHDENDRVVCHCFGVTESEILRVVRENNLTAVDQVTNYCKAGGACGKCKDDIASIIMRVTKENTTAAASQAKPLTNLQKIKKIQEVIDRDISPMLKRDGGDIELVDVDGDKVTIAFRGLCSGCASASVTRDDVVQAKLREFVSPDIVVVEESK